MTIIWPGAPKIRQLPFRRLFTPLNRPVPPDAEIVTAYTDGQVTLRSNRAKIGYHEAADLSSYQGVEAGDFVVHGLDILRGSVGVSDSSGAMSPVCTVCKPSPLVVPRFVAHAIRAQAESGYTKAMARGIREGGADFRRWATLAELPVPVPPVEYQRKAVAFLDRETMQIDTLISEQQKLIEMLKERRQAMIDHAFVRLPKERVQLRRFIMFLTSGSRGWGEYYADSGDAFVRIGNLPRGSLSLGGEVQRVILPSTVHEGQRTKLRAGDLLFSITAYIGSVAVVDEKWRDSYVSQHVALCRIATSVLDPHFTGYFMLTTEGQDHLSEGAAGGTKVQLALDDIRALRVPVPSLIEQRQIVDHLDRETSQIDTLIAESQQVVELSQERRTALITAAVTGQIDVRQEG